MRSKNQSLRKLDFWQRKKTLLLTSLLDLMTDLQMKLKLQSFVISQKNPPPHGFFFKMLHNKAHLHLQKHAFMSQVENLQKTQYDSILPHTFKVVINVICCLRDLMFVRCNSCL